jgi:hypothetical protein
MENAAPITNLNEADTLEAGLQTLRGHGLVAQVEQRFPGAGTNRGDALVRIGYGGQPGVVYTVECKRWITPKTVGAIAARMQELGPNALLMTGYATQTVAEQLKAQGIAFADAAGNAYLRGPNFLIWANGRKPLTENKAPRAGRAWQPAGIRVIFALLCNPDWINLGYRDLAARAGVANGTVGQVMRDLDEQGFLVKPRRRKLGRQLVQRRRLLDRWVEFYTGTFRQTTLLGRYKADNFEWWKTLDARKYAVMLGGETAGAILTEFLKPGIVTVYGRDIPPQLMIEHRLRKADDGNIEIRQRFWTFDYVWNHPDLTPPVLVYADLLATGDARCIETAQKVYDGHLAGLVAEG